MSSSQSAADLLLQAAGGGAVPQDALQAFAIMNVQTGIQQALGIGVDDVDASEVFLLVRVIDDSSSIAQIKANPADPQPMNGPTVICFGSNLIAEALGDSKQSGDILVSTILMNRGVVEPFTPLANGVKLENGKNYTASGSTPLYDSAITAVGAVMAKQQEFRQAGVPARAAVLIVTDGADYGSRSRPSAVAAAVKAALKTESVLIYFMGIDDGETDFRKVAESMGIEGDFVLTPKKTASDIRAKFMVVSKSTVRASQGGQGFSQAGQGLGGFGAP